MAGEKDTDIFENCQKQLQKAICTLDGKTATEQPSENGQTVRMSWNEKLLKKDIKRGHVWIWLKDREIKNKDNFVEVGEDALVRENESRVGFEIKSRNIRLKRYRKVAKPIGFHDESLEEWLLGRMYNGNNNGNANGSVRVVRQGCPAEYDARLDAWNERFVRKGLRKGLLWIWWENREIKNKDNFVEVDESFIAPENGGSEPKATSQMKRKREMQFHDESLDEWLIKKIIFHGENLMKELERGKQTWAKKTKAKRKRTGRAKARSKPKKDKRTMKRKRGK